MKLYTAKQSEPRLGMLLFGHPGAGKTYLAATAMDHPDMNDVLFLNIENGYLTIADREYQSVDIGRDEHGRPNGHALKDLEDVTWAVVTKAKGFEKFKTVVLDGLTELQVRDLEDVVLEFISRGKNREIDELTQNDYGKDTARMRRVLRMLRDAKLNVILTALAKEIIPKDETKPTEVIPSLTKALSQSVQGYFDFCWYLAVDKEGTRFLLTQPRGPYRVKTRYDRFAQKLGATVKDPHLGVIYDLLCNTLKESK